MSVEDTRSIARKIIEQLNRRNLDGIVELAAPDARWHGFMSPEPLDSTAYRGMMSALLQAFPNSRFVLDDLIAEDGKAVIRHTFSGTQQGEFASTPATGQHVSVPASFAFHAAHGKLTEGWLNADFLGMLQQLGVVPTPAPAS